MLSVRWTEGALMMALLGVYAALEGFGIGLLLPVLQYLESGGRDLPTGGIWPYLVAATDAVQVEITLGSLLALAFAPILLRQVVYYIIVWNNAAVQNRAVERLMVRLFREVTQAELSYFESEDQGRFISVITGQVARSGQALIQYIKLLSTLIVLLVYTAILAFLSWQLTVIAVLAMVLSSLVVRRVMVSSRRHGSEVTRSSVTLTSAVRERLAALRLVKMRAQEAVEADRIGVLAARLRQASTRIAIAGARVEVVVDPALMLSVFVIVYVGVRQFNMTLAGLGLFMFILLRLNTKAKELNIGRQQLASLMPSFDYVESMLTAAEAAPTPRGGDTVFEGLRDAIRLDDVWFSYGSGDTDVLKGVTLEIPRGSLTAIVGRSGAGKSTLVDMIPLLRRPQSGSITFDGVPAEEYDLASLRRRIGFLTQEPILFNDTIEANMTYGLGYDVGEAEMRRALEERSCQDRPEAAKEWRCGRTPSRPCVGRTFDDPRETRAHSPERAGVHGDALLLLALPHEEAP